ncbi:Sugar (and other) transporter [Geosmithia morbida]|uniref:Sugar (And other) transporter n=1 Tax=Geosmithia morbida TaxID=1094350 RepID=A0A9P5D3H1_9HYPO|nr:Sugar (and other) transporter [Geosmithia morbida]KAF4122536.1 Sugar (and other) transporter [Geosmithia morbida]
MLRATERRCSDADPVARPGPDSHDDDSHDDDSHDDDYQSIPSREDVESALSAEDNLVTFDGPDDPANPLNWSRRAKWTATILVSSFTFVSPIASTMLSPSLPDLEDEFGTSGFETNLIMSIFLLAYAIGPFIIAPLSEMYGRVVVLQSSNMVFLLFNTVCGFSKTKAEIMVFRFLSGLGGAAPQAIGSGVLSDCWSADERGGAVAIYSLAPFLGPVIGPIAGGYLTQYISWRWIFWAISILDAVVQVLALFFLPETYRPAILAKKARRLRRSTGNKNYLTEVEAANRTWAALFRKSIVRPLIMLTTQPTIQITGLYRGYLYGLMYLVLASFPAVWKDKYDQEPGRASLNYISLGIGTLVANRSLQTYKHLKEKHNTTGCPEYRIPLMFPTAIIAPSGLLLYGLAAHYEVHWIVPNIGTAIFAMGLILSFQCAQTYIIDCYETYAASAAGASAFMRTMAGFGFPLFANKLYESLGIAGGNGLLAGVAFGICLVVSSILWKYGKWIRKKSPYCAG